MESSDSLQAASRVLVGAPTAVLPVFLAATGAVLVPQVFVLLGLATAYLWLRGTGRIERFADAVAAVSERGTESGDPGGSPTTPTGSETNGTAVDRLGDAMAGLLTPEVVGILLVTAAIAFVVGLVARSVATAGRVHTAVGAMRGDPPVEAGIEGARRRWLSFVGFALLRLLVLVAPTVVYLGVVAAAAAVSAGLGLLAFVLGGLVWLAVFLAGHLLLLFVPQAIAVEGVGVGDALGHNWRFLREHPGRAVLYVIVQVALAVAGVVALAVLVQLNADRLLSLVAAVAVGPWLALFKTGLYLEVEPPTVDSAPAADRFRAAFGRGGADLRGFVGSQPVTIAGCGAVFAVATLGGYLVAAPYSMGIRAPEDPRQVFGTVPVDHFVTIATNNWLVAVSQTFAGLALGVPALSNLVFNGLLVGLVVGFTFELPVAVAFLAPHGILEVPALVVSGAVGAHLGRHTWRYLRGGTDAAALAAELRRGFRILLALAPVFVVAAAIEAFVTPWVAVVVG